VRPTKCCYCGSREVYQDETVPRSTDYSGEAVAHYWTCADCGWASEPVVQEPPEPCPMGCGRTTEDVAGGPCEACWELAPRREP
jgi:hypothetical protein